MFQIQKNHENYPILNAYNFLYKTYFEKLTGNLIELISKNKFTSLFFLNCTFLKSWKIFKCYICIVEYRLPASYLDLFTFNNINYNRIL